MPVDLVEPASSPSTWTGSVCATPPTCTPEGFRHFSFVKDISRDWSLAGHAATHLRTDLGLDALKMAVAPRPPAAGELVEITRVTRASTPSHSTRGARRPEHRRLRRRRQRHSVVDFVPRCCRGLGPLVITASPAWAWSVRRGLAGGSDQVWRLTLTIDREIGPRCTPRRSLTDTGCHPRTSRT
jgi:hypothetical protein